MPSRLALLRGLLLLALALTGGALFTRWLQQDPGCAQPGHQALVLLLGTLLIVGVRAGYARVVWEGPKRWEASFPLGRSFAHRLSEVMADLAGLPGQESNQLRALCEALGLTRAALYRFDATSSTWWWVADTTRNEPKVIGAVRGSPLAQGMPLLAGYNTGLPLSGRTGLVGMLAMDRPGRARRLSASEQRALAQVCGMLAITLENQWLGRDLLDKEIATRKALEDKSVHDRVNAVVSHQLKTPLLVGQALISDALSSLHDRVRVARRLDKLEASLTRFERNVMQNFDRQGIDSSRFRIVLSTLHLPTVLARCLDEARYMLRKREITATIELPPNLWVIADPPRLEVVLDNLIGNALKAMGSGGALRIRAGKEAHGVWLEIADSGSGIPAERLEGLFQVQPPNPDDPTSTGVGLSICREYLEAMGGGISLAANGPKGVTFRLTFRNAQKNTAPLSGAASRFSSSGPE